MKVELSEIEIKEIVILLSILYDLSLVGVHRNRAKRFYSKFKGFLR